jgi:propionyl-CoA carboxylase alpha chain
LRHPAFLSGRVDTDFLQRPEAGPLTEPLLTENDERLLAAAAALYEQTERRAAAEVLPSLPSGWRNNPSVAQLVAYRGIHGVIEVAYRFSRAGDLDLLCVDSVELGAPSFCMHGNGAASLEVDGVRQQCRITRAGAHVYVNSSSRQARLTEVSRFPVEEAAAQDGSLMAPMPGAVVRVDVRAGDRVDRGQPMMVIEAMKMEHEVVAPATAVVRALLVSPGDQVEAGEPLALLEGDETPQ